MQSEDQIRNSDSSSFRSDLSDSSSDLQSDELNLFDGLDSESESDVEKEEENYGYSLHNLAANNDVEHLTSKLQSQEKLDIDFNEKNENGRTALHIATIENIDQSHYELIEILLKNGADPNAKDEYGLTPLWYLVKDCNINILNLFMKFKADFYGLNDKKESLLERATTNLINIDVIRFLIKDIGLNVNHRNANDRTPLIEAAYENKNASHYHVLKYLLELGADVNFQDDDGFTPLHILVRAGNWKVVELFLNYNANVYAVNKNGDNILFEFSDENSNAQVLNKLINKFGLDVNHSNEDKDTPFHCIMDQFYQSKFINIEVVKCLLINGANINTPNKDGYTPIIETVFQINEETEEWFLENLNCFSFLVNQTDFSVVHNNKHIFSNYYGQRRPKFFSKWILKYIAKLDFLKITIHPFLKNYIEDFASYENYANKCTKELEFMSNTKPQNSWITFFNLLVDNRKRLKNYAGNKDLIQDYKNNDWLEKFPIYGDLLNKNVKKGLRRRELFDKSTIFLSDCLPVFNSTHLIVKDIFDCILSKKYLSQFCKCRFLP